ncbi:hypothetical protein D3C73_1462330 [compost metagenome]
MLPLVKSVLLQVSQLAVLWLKEVKIQAIIPLTSPQTKKEKYNLKIPLPGTLNWLFLYQQVTLNRGLQARQLAALLLRVAKIQVVV